MKTVCVILFLFLILCLSPAWSQTAKNIAYLKGTYYSLDMYNGNMKDGAPMPMGDGLLSKCGWTFIDDSRSYLFDHSEWPWLKERPDTTKAQDWYFLCYGHNYKKALRMFTKFSGKVPLPPRYAFGYWWSRYWSYSDDELRTLIVDVGSVGSEEVKTVEISYPSDNQCMANGEIGQMRRVRENVCLLKERDANIVLTDDLANMESVGRAITYAPSSFTQKMEFFHDRYARLDEVLKAQKLNDADYKFFIDYTY